VQRALRASGHCGASNPERREAFDDLFAWVETGKWPEGDNVLGDPTKLGLRWTLVWNARDPAAPHK